MVDLYIANNWNIDTFIRPWFDDPYAFRLALRKCDAFVSGSQLVQFFGRTTYSGSDFDIYVSAGSALAMGRFIRRSGYVFDPRRCDGPTFESTMYSATAEIYSHRDLRRRYGSRDILRVYYFLDDSRSREVQLIVTRHQNPLWMVMRHHSCESLDYRCFSVLKRNVAAVMNFLTWDRAVSLFPLSTFAHDVSYMARRPLKFLDGTRYSWVEKWESRGFSLIGNEHTVLRKDIPHGRRRIYDRYSWVIRWDLNGTCQCGLLYDIILMYLLRRSRPAALSRTRRGQSIVRRVSSHVRYDFEG